MLNLPAYSPDLNPIEQFWSQLKRLVKEGKKKVDSTVEAIDQAFKQLINLDPSGYFEHFFKIIYRSF